MIEFTIYRLVKIHPLTAMFKTALVLTALASGNAFMSTPMKSRVSKTSIQMVDEPPEIAAMNRRNIAGGQKGNVPPPEDYKKKQMDMGIKKQDDSKGTRFSYDPSKYQDSANEGNYRRLSDALSAAKVCTAILTS